MDELKSQRFGCVKILCFSLSLSFFLFQQPHTERILAHGGAVSVFAAPSAIWTPGQQCILSGRPRSKEKGVGGNDAHGRWWEDAWARSTAAIPEAGSRERYCAYGENLAKAAGVKKEDRYQVELLLDFRIRKWWKQNVWSSNRWMLTVLAAASPEGRATTLLKCLISIGHISVSHLLLQIQTLLWTLLSVWLLFSFSCLVPASSSEFDFGRCDDDFDPCWLWNQAGTAMAVNRANSTKCSHFIMELAVLPCTSPGGPECGGSSPDWTAEKGAHDSKSLNMPALYLCRLSGSRPCVSNPLITLRLHPFPHTCCSYAVFCPFISIQEASLWENLFCHTLTFTFQLTDLEFANLLQSPCRHCLFLACVMHQKNYDYFF